MGFLQIMVDFTDVVVDIAIKHGYVVIMNNKEDHVFSLQYRDVANDIVGFSFDTTIYDNIVNLLFWNLDPDCDLKIDLCEPNSIEILDEHFRKIREIDREPHLPSGYDPRWQ